MPDLAIIPADAALELSRFGVPIWTRRDGSTLYIDQMEDNHLISTLAILGRWRRDCAKRGDDDMATTLKTTIDMLKREQRRRNRQARAKLRLSKP